MDLNAAAIADLPTDTVVDETIIHSAPIAEPTDQSTLIIPKTKYVKDKVTQLTEAEVQQIAQTDVTFRLLNGEVEHVVDLADIEKEFLAQESIDRNTAKFLNEHFEGLLSTRMSLEEFTRVPSRTNLQITRNHVRMTLSQEQAEALNSLSKFATEPLDDVSKLLTSIKERHLPVFSDAMSDTRDAAQRLLTNVDNSKNLIVPYQTGDQVEFVDVADLDLIQLDFNKLQVTHGSVQHLSLYKEAIDVILSNSDVKSLIGMVTDYQEVTYPVNTAVLATIVEKPISLLVLAKFFSDDVLRAYLETFSNTTDMLVETISAIQVAVANIEDFDQLQQYLVEHSAQIHETINTALRIASTVNNLSVLALNVKEAFSYLSQLVLVE